MTSPFCQRCRFAPTCRTGQAGTVENCFAFRSRGPRRILNRRFDPLRRLSPADWARRLTRFGEITPALVCACNRLRFDYEASAPATVEIRARYRSLAQLPPKAEIRRYLRLLGYPPIQADRAVASYGDSYKVRNRLEVNAYDRQLAALVAPNYRP